MMSFPLAQKIFVLTAIISVAFGAGCLKKNQSSAPPDPKLEQLRQPPAAAAPLKEPTIPQEAAKVPRPY